MIVLWVLLALYLTGMVGLVGFLLYAMLTWEEVRRGLLELCGWLLLAALWPVLALGIGVFYILERRECVK